MECLHLVYSFHVHQPLDAFYINIWGIVTQVYYYHSVVPQRKENGPVMISRCTILSYCTPAQIMWSHEGLLSPHHTIMDWGYGWVKIAYIASCWSSGTHPSMSVYLHIDVHWFWSICWRVLCMFKIVNGQPMNYSPVVVHSLSIPNLFCVVFVHYLSGTRAVIYVQIWLSCVCEPWWQIINGHAMDKTDIYHTYTARVLYEEWSV